MADSNITKKALASALKELMQEKPFEKISVGDICEKCDMNRKSFYYHFKDKYDLVNWIFDTEFIEISRENTYEDDFGWYEDVCRYFYDNRAFYKKALRITGQNSFTSHFRDVMSSILSRRFEEIFGKKLTNDFQMNFYTDAIVVAFYRWMIEETNMTAEEFIDNIKLCLQYMAMRSEDFDY